MAQKVKEKKNTFTPLTIVLLVFLCIYCLSLFYLLAWGLFTSFKVNEEVFKVKKSSYSKKIVKLLKKEYKEDLEKSKIKTELNSSADSKY